MTRFLACLLSFALVAGSIPPEVFSQIRPIRPFSGQVRPGPQQGTFSSLLDFYGWINTFPEFQDQGAAGFNLTAQVLVQAAPLFREGPVGARKEGGRIALFPGNNENPQPLVSIGLPTENSASEAVLALAQELQKARESDLMGSTVSHADQVLRRYYEQFQSLAEQGTPIESSGPRAALELPVASSKPEFWLIFERLLAEELELKIHPGKTEAWKRETAKLFRDRPGMPLIEALAESFGKIHFIKREKIGEIESLLYSREKDVWKQAGAGELFHVTKINGRLYAAAENGLYIRARGRWTRDPNVIGTVSYIFEEGGKIYLGHSAGVDLKTNNGVEPELRDVNVRGNRVYAGWTYQIAKLDGKLYAANSEGLFVKRGRFWARENLRAAGPVFYVTSLDGRLYAGTSNGVHVNSGRGWRLAPEDMGRVERVVRLDGKTYAASDGDLYIMQKGGRWRRAVQGIDLDRDSVSVGGRIYFGTANGIFRKTSGWIKQIPKTQELTPKTRKLILKDINQEIEQLRKSQERPDPPSLEPFKADEQENIFGEDGRTLFSGFQRTAGFFFGFLSAGALEVLSRLALSLGNLSLGFGEESEPEKSLAQADSSVAPEAANQDIWLNLEGWIQEGLDLRLESVRTEQWKKGTVEILRNNPSLPLEKALSMGFARTYGLSPEIEKKIEFFLANPGMRRELKNTNIYSVDRLGVALYVRAKEGLYKLEGGRAVPVLTDAGRVHKITQVGDSIYVGAEKGLYRIKGGEAAPVLRDAGWVHKITQVGDSIYVGANKGLYKLNGGEAVPVLTDAGRVYEITQVGDSIYVGAEKGLYRIKGGEAAPVLRDAGWVHKITQVGDSIYVGAGKGLYRIKGGKAVPVLRDVGWVYEITQIGDSIYVRANKGLYRIKGGEAVPVLKGVNIRQIKEGDGKIYLVADKGFFTWHLPPENLRNLQESILKEISKTTGQMQKSPGLASPAEPFKTDEKGNILSEDGRALFSGFQKAGSLVLGMLGAGALEGLSRLALSLGNLSLGFGEEERALDSPEKPADFWSVLESGIKAMFDRLLSLGKGLGGNPTAGTGKGIRTGKTREWRKEAAEILRSDPGRNLEKTLAEAFSRVHGLLPAAAGLTELFLKEPEGRSAKKWIRRVALWNGKLYMVRKDGLFVLNGRSWELLMGGEAHDIVAVDGKLYATVGAGLYREEGSHWELVLEDKEGVIEIKSFSGRTYGETSAGLYVKEGDRWVMELEGIGVRVDEMIQENGVRYAAISHSGVRGLYVQKKGSWERIFEGVFKIVSLDGKVYAGTDHKVYVAEGDSWRTVLEGVGNLYRLKKIEEKLYAVTDEGIYASGKRRWRRVSFSPRDFFQTDFVCFHDISRWDGNTYMATNRGLYRLREESLLAGILDFFIPGLGRWKKELNKKIDYTVKMGERLYAVSEWGAYLKERGEWRNSPISFGNSGPRQIALDGKLYLTADSELFLQKGGQWRRMLEDAGDINEVSVLGGKLYAVADEEVYVQEADGWKTIVGRVLAENWREEILRDIGEEIGRLRKIQEERGPVAGEPPRADENGNILGEDGRALFSGFRRTANVFLGLLSAGALEGLSRLALSLGNLNLGFGEGETASHSSPEGEEGGDSSEEGAGKASGDPLEALLEAYKVPASERNLRKKLTLQAVERIKTDIALFTGDPHVRVQFGDWWVTGQSLDGSYKVIEIPLEDIFIRAVDEKGVEEAVGAAIHETLHYLVTRSDPNSPLIQKYVLTESPKANNLLYQSAEDTRINAWGLLKQPGFTPYMDSMYEAEWPENPGDAEALKRARLGILSRSAIEIEFPDKKKKSWVAPHIQYADSIIYYWRHRKAPPFLTDPLAKEVFEKTKDSLDRIRNIHPREMGGILLEEMKKKAGTEALEALDREIYPHYEKLVQKSKKDLQDMLEKGAKARRPQGQGSQGQKGKPRKGQGGGSQGAQSQVDDLLDEIAEELAEKIHGHAAGKKEGKERGKAPGQKPEGKDEAPGRNEAEPGKGTGKDNPDSWANRRPKAEEEAARLQRSWTTYERYKLRAKELGLIDKVDGIIKKILLPTTHVRLSRNHYHEGDEPDLDKYLDDVAQGRLDTPVMKVWNRRIRRSAKISLVLDISGSMGSMTETMDSPLDYGILGIVGWAEVCQKNNLDFEVILFDHSQYVIHPFGKTVNTKAKEHIIEEIAKIRGGSTAIGEAFRRALSNILKQHATHRFIIFATDEEHNTGDAPETWMPQAKKNKIVTIAMVIGAGESGYKHFDYAVRVERAEDFPRDLLNVLKAAIRSILGPLGWMR